MSEHGQAVKESAWCSMKQTTSDWSVGTKCVHWPKGKRWALTWISLCRAWISQHQKFSMACSRTVRGMNGSGPVQLGLAWLGVWTWVFQVSTNTKFTTKTFVADKSTSAGKTQQRQARVLGTAMKIGAEAQPARTTATERSLEKPLKPQITTKVSTIRC